MPNRYQQHQSGRQDRDYDRGYSNRNRDDEGRFSGAEDDRHYGSYADNDEGDSSVRAGNYDHGRGRPRRDSHEQSGSGRYAGQGDFGQGDYRGGRQGYSGQDRYGQGQRGNRSNPSDSDWQDRQRRQGNHAGGSRSFSGYGYGSAGTFNEPYGEGQQYTSSGQYGGDYGAESGSQGFGGRDSAREGYGYGSSGRDQSWSQGGQQWGQGQGQGGQGRGMHHGKGPKGYQRSDDRLKELICERLREDPEIDPSEVTLSVQGGKVTLDGTVDSRHAKNAIEDIAEQFGVQEVQNNLRVQRASQPGETAGTSGKSRSEDSTTGRQNKH